MKAFYSILLLSMILIGCNQQKKDNVHRSMDFNARRTAVSQTDADLKHGETYLSIYSEIYSNTEHTTHNLTATVSMRNTSIKDTVFVFHSNYYDTHGELIRTYFKEPIYIAPVETVEIVIHEDDRQGGTGGNFIFEWGTSGSAEPIFEAVMISTSGQQGLSFTTQGKRID